MPAALALVGFNCKLRCSSVAIVCIRKAERKFFDFQMRHIDVYRAELTEVLDYTYTLQMLWYVLISEHGHTRLERLLLQIERFPNAQLSEKPGSRSIGAFCITLRKLGRVINLFPMPYRTSTSCWDHKGFSPNASYGIKS
jgi:hypothetical protein